MKTCQSNVQRAIDNNDMEELARVLPPLQRKFAEALVADETMNGAAAVITAGSTSKNPHKVAHMWRYNPGVTRYIDYLLEQRAKKMKVDQTYVIRKLIRTLERCESEDNFQPQSVLRALELLGKHLAMFTEKTELTGKDGEAIRLEKVNNDADAFTRAIAGLVKRAGEDGVAEDTKH